MMLARKHLQEWSRGLASYTYPASIDPSGIEDHSYAYQVFGTTSEDQSCQERQKKKGFKYYSVYMYVYT